jgi:hypothetical protein
MSEVAVAGVTGDRLYLSNDVFRAESPSPRRFP